MRLTSVREVLREYAVSPDTREKGKGSLQPLLALTAVTAYCYYYYYYCYHGCRSYQPYLSPYPHTTPTPPYPHTPTDPRTHTHHVMLLVM